MIMAAMVVVGVDMSASGMEALWAGLWRRCMGPEWPWVTD
jgi:hypothetical protein